MSEQQITLFDRFRSIEQALIAAHTPLEIKGVIAMTDAAVAFAKTYFRDQREVVERAKTMKLRAERRLGEVLEQMPKATGAAAGGKKDGPRGTYLEPRGSAPTLSELGIDKKLSSRAQRLAAIPEEEFESVATGQKALKDVLSRPKARLAKRPTKIGKKRLVQMAEAEKNHISTLAMYARQLIKELAADREFSDEEIDLLEQVIQSCAHTVRRGAALPV